MSISKITRAHETVCKQKINMNFSKKQSQDLNILIGKSLSFCHNNECQS